MNKLILDKHRVIQCVLTMLQEKNTFRRLKEMELSSAGLEKMNLK